MGNASLLLSIDGGIARITLDRPDLSNALTGDVNVALAEAADTVAADPSVRVLLLASTGKMFSAGGDIREFVTILDRLGESVGEGLLLLNATLLKIAALRIPIVAALNGPVAGGGMGLALAADVLIAAASVKFRAGYAAIGLSPDAGTSYHLARILGPKRAKEFFFTNRFIDAPEALALGLVSRVVPDEDLAEEAETLVRTIANMPPGALAAAKTLVDEAADASYPEILERERRLMIKNASSPEAREGITAFMERRRPAFAR